MTETRYGGFWRRAVAFLIDNVLLNTAATLVMMIGLIAVGVEADPIDTGTGPLFVAYYGTAGLMNLFYFTYFHGTTGQTVGKRILGLRVVRLSGEPMTLGAAFLRWVGYIVSGLVFYLGFLWIAFDARKQGWHDKIAGTCVVRVGPAVPPPAEQPDLFSKMP